MVWGVASPLRSLTEDAVAKLLFSEHGRLKPAACLEMGGLCTAIGTLKRGMGLRLPM